MLCSLESESESSIDCPVPQKGRGLALIEAVLSFFRDPELLLGAREATETRKLRDENPVMRA